MLIGLTGGIGSGKSTVSAGLAQRGAAVVDADAVAREVVAPGGPAYQPVVDRFGDEIVGPDGHIDRPALAAIVFADPAALQDLNDLTHPVIGRVVAERAALAAQTHDVVILDLPLLSPGIRSRLELDAIVVVDAPIDEAVRRLVGQRGFGEDDARARVAAQIGRDERRALADLIIDNAADRSELEAEIDRAWAWIRERVDHPGA